MFLFGGNNNKPFYAALFDVGSGTVGIAIAEFIPGKPIPHIIFSQRVQMRVSKNESKKTQILRKVRESIFSSALTLSQDGVAALTSYKAQARITQVFATCASPWSYNLARTVDYHDDEPFKISKAIIDDLVHSAEEAIFKDLRTKDETDTKEYSVVEQASVDISVNDYTVTDPINLKGTSVSLSHIVGLIPTEITESIAEVQQKLFPGTRLRTHTYMLIMYCILRDIFPRISSLCIIDVTGEAVEFGVVEHGLLVENNSFNFGSSTFIREAMEITGRPFSDVLSILKDYQSKEVETKSIDALIDKYVDIYSDAVNSVMEDRVVSNDIVLTTHRSLESIFKFILEKAFEKATGVKHTLLTIDPSLVDQISSGSGDDVYLALEARFFHKLHGCGEIVDK